MGCDGGTIPRRDELVRVKKKPEQVRKRNKKTSKNLLYKFFILIFVFISLNSFCIFFFALIFN